MGIYDSKKDRTLSDAFKVFLPGDRKTPSTTGLKVGDTITCKDVDDAAAYGDALKAAGYVYEGIKLLSGEWVLTITGLPKEYVPGTGDAYMIVKDLANDKIPDEEKLKAIERVFNTRSYHFAYKQDLWDIIEYLLERIEKQDADTKA